MCPQEKAPRRSPPCRERVEHYRHQFHEEVQCHEREEKVRHRDARERLTTSVVYRKKVTSTTTTTIFKGNAPSPPPSSPTGRACFPSPTTTFSWEGNFPFAGKWPSSPPPPFPHDDAATASLPPSPPSPQPHATVSTAADIYRFIYGLLGYTHAHARARHHFLLNTAGEHAHDITQAQVYLVGTETPTDRQLTGEKRQKQP